MISGLCRDIVLKSAQKKTIDEIVERDPFSLTPDEQKGIFIINNNKIEIVSASLDINVGYGKYYLIYDMIVPRDLTLIRRKAEYIYEDHLKTKKLRISENRKSYINKGNLCIYGNSGRVNVFVLEHLVLENITTVPITNQLYSENYRLVLFVDMANIKYTRCISQFQKLCTISGNEIEKVDVFSTDGKRVDCRNIYTK